MNLLVNIGKTIADWLDQEYRRRHLQRAINHAYATFAQQYPLWAESLFDEQFLTRQAAPILKSYWTGEGALDAIALAQAWTQQMKYWDEAMRQRHITALIPIATKFLQLLEAELDDNKSVVFNVQTA